MTTTVPIDPATVWAGEDTVTARTGAAVVVVVAEFVAGVAPSPVSDKVADVVWAPGVEENVTDAPIVPRAVPDAMGVEAVEVQVSTVLAPESTHDQPTGLGSALNVPPLGAVTVITGSVKAGPPATDRVGVTTTVPADPAAALAGPEVVTTGTGVATHVIVVPFEAGVAPSAGSESVVVADREPGAVAGATATVAPNVPSVPAAMGVAVVDVQVSVSFTTVVVLRAQVYPAGVGAAVNVSPAGRIDLTTGSLFAGAEPEVIAGPMVSV